MSKDALLTHRCPHLTLEERSFLGTDRATLLTRQRIASSSSVRISVNDQFLVPPAGLYSQARLTGTSSGPFRVIENETSFVVASKTSSLSLDIPTGSRVETNTIVVLINRSSPSTGIVAENNNGHLALLETKRFGGESLLQVSGRAATALGFGDVSGARGRQVFPSWKVVLTRPTTPTTLAQRLIRFGSIVKQNPIFKVTYTATPDSCLRCRASLIENDWRHDTQGELITIENENLLYQACLKILLTDRNSNPFHPWYGTEIRTRLGQKSIGAAAAKISEDVRRALENLQSVQTKQAQAQQVSYKERLYRILGVQTWPHKEDPTTFLVDVVVQNASQEAVSLSIVFTVPDVIALQSPQGPTLNALTAGLSPERLRRLFPVSG